MMGISMDTLQQLNPGYPQQGSSTVAEGASEGEGGNSGGNNATAAVGGNDGTVTTGGGSGGLEQDVNIPCPM